MAFCASASESNTTVPQPLLLPECLSVTISVVDTPPTGLNRSFRSCHAYANGSPCTTNCSNINRADERAVSNVQLDMCEAPLGVLVLNCAGQEAVSNVQLDMYEAPLDVFLVNCTEDTSVRAQVGRIENLVAMEPLMLVS